MTINKFDNLKFEKTQDIWQFDLKTKTWKNRGKSAVFFGNNPQNFQYQNYYSHNIPIAYTQEEVYSLLAKYFPDLN